MGSKLLTREEFRNAILEWDSHKCVSCGKLATVAHHLIDRKLWGDGGYYLDNGVSLCSTCHWEAEKGKISPQELRKMAGINLAIVPESLNAKRAEEYNKWGEIPLTQDDLSFFAETVERSYNELDDADWEDTKFSPRVQEVLKSLKSLQEEIENELFNVRWYGP